MKTERKKALVIAGSSALIVIAAIVVVLLFVINSHKPGIETADSRVIGLNVRINGKMGHSFFPLRVSVNDIHVAKRPDLVSS
jgi:uncharacterized protein involved in outer membrane biogenesis